MNKQLLQLEVMLKLQDELNTKINPNWKTADQDWLRATWIECAELMEFIGWKWWKKQNPNLAQAHIELCDCMHFLLSYYIVQHDKNVTKSYDLKISERLLNCLECSMEYAEDVDVSKSLTYVEELIHEIFREKNSSSLTDTSMIMGAFFDLCISLNLSFDKLYEMYISKNVLNVFRQNHGYKDGSYIKEWPSPLDHGTVEDNVILETILLNKATQNVLEQNPKVAFDYLYEQLKVHYPG